MESPPHEKLENIFGSTCTLRKSPDNEQFLMFYSTSSVFSNFHPSKFTMNGLVFTSNEQYYQYKKAEFFQDSVKMKMILSAQTPGLQKKLGCSIDDFDKEEWSTVSRQHMFNGCYGKFAQNPSLSSKLKSTDGWTLVEASPSDLIWGIGLSRFNPSSSNRDNWRGQNLLGQVLMEIRDNYIGLKQKPTQLLSVEMKEEKSSQFLLSYDFINFYLQTRGIYWRECPDCPALENPDQLKITMRRMGLAYLSSHCMEKLLKEIEMTKFTQYKDFEKTASILISEGINWISIISLFVFSAQLAEKCCLSKQFFLVRRIADWVHIWLSIGETRHWIDRNGWETFMKIYCLKET